MKMVIATDTSPSVINLCGIPGRVSISWNPCSRLRFLFEGVPLMLDPRVHVVVWLCRPVGSLPAGTVGAGPPFPLIVASSFMAAFLGSLCNTFPLISKEV